MTTAPHFPTGIPGLDKLLGGGIFEGGVYLIAMEAGAGKTTLCLHAVKWMDKPVLFVTADPVPEYIGEHGFRMGVQGDSVTLLRPQSIDHAVARIAELTPALVIVDDLPSVVSISNGRMNQRKLSSEIMDGFLKIHRIVKHHSLTSIVMTGLTKSDDVRGGRFIQHTADAVYRGKRGKMLNGTVRLVQLKDKFAGEIHEAAFRVTMNGLEDVTA